MTFAPDILEGSPSLATNNWLYLWVYLVFYNGIWVVVPLALMYQSWVHMEATFQPLPQEGDTSHETSTTSSRKKYGRYSKSKRKEH